MIFHFETTLIAVWIGFLLDLLIGDPHWLYHPVQAIGKLISVSEKFYRGIFKKTPEGERMAGSCLVITVVVLGTGIPTLILAICYHINLYLGVFVEAFMCYQLVATKALKSESMKVHKELAKGDLEGGRKAVSMIVGRDTQNLSVEGVTKAAVETVAENASDGVIAPLFYMMIGGAPLAFLYKSINTMDSMIAYKNEKYLHFGRTAAKLDDLANFIPSRLSAAFMILSAYLIGMDGPNALKIYKRDRRKHASPNSAQTESVMAGALDVQLAGDAWYFGELHKKDFIGDPIRKVEVDDIARANKLLYATAFASMLIMGAVRVIVLTVL